VKLAQILGNIIKKAGGAAGAVKLFIDGLKQNRYKSVELESIIDSFSQKSTLPYDFYEGSAVVYNNEIHILGSQASGNQTKHYKWNGNSW
jgi:hypothetical protein